RRVGSASAANARSGPVTVWFRIMRNCIVTGIACQRNRRGPGTLSRADSVSKCARPDPPRSAGSSERTCGGHVKSRDGPAPQNPAAHYRRFDIQYGTLSPRGGAVMETRLRFADVTLVWLAIPVADQESS